MTNPLRPALISLLAFAVFAAHDVVIKLLGAAYSPFQIVFFSVLFGFPLTLLMLVRDKTAGTLIPKRPGWTITRTIAAVISGAAAFYAFSVLPLAQVYVILFAMPLLVTVLSIPVLGETVRLRRWLAVIAGLCGVIVMLRPGTVPLELGHMAALVAAICSALASVIVRKIGREERPIVLLIYPMLASFVLMAALLPWVYQPMPLGHLAAVALIAVLAHVAMRLMIRAYQIGEATTVAPMQYSQILWATAYGYLLFEELPDMMTVLGASIIIASGLYILMRERQPGLSANRPATGSRSRAETATHPRTSAVLRTTDRGESP